MTAEIAILNKHGIALAADSKVSITSPAGGKAYDSVNKVFTLSKYEPVGIMVFGSAEFMQTPWELVIKSYREQLSKSQFDHLEQYAQDFLEYTTNFMGTTSEDVEINVQSILASAFSDDFNHVKSLASERDFKIGSTAYIEFLREYFVIRSDALFESLYFEKFEEQLGIARVHRDQVKLVSRSLSRYKSKSLQRAVRRYLHAVLFSQELSSQASGIVVAGYGKSENFPVIVEYATDGIVNDTINWSE